MLSAVYYGYLWMTFLSRPFNSLETEEIHSDSSFNKAEMLPQCSHASDKMSAKEAKLQFTIPRRAHLKAHSRIVGYYVFLSVYNYAYYSLDEEGEICANEGGRMRVDLLCIAENINSVAPARSRESLDSPSGLATVTVCRKKEEEEKEEEEEEERQTTQQQKHRYGLTWRRLNGRPIRCVLLGCFGTQGDQRAQKPARTRGESTSAGGPEASTECGVVHRSDASV
ncbi:UNVERIFIED_CONTAM: hypothetical protein K2H54_042338 [Gekko kuhli]